MVLLFDIFHVVLLCMAKLVRVSGLHFDFFSVAMTSAIAIGQKRNRVDNIFDKCSII